MKIVVRYFFRAVRVILTPVVLLSEALTTPKPIHRDPAVQQRVDAECQKLALYQFRACPFCIKVRKSMRRLNLPIETRDAQQVQTYREELLAGGGRVKVPCLQIEHDNGEVEWMYESDTIIAYLNQRFAPPEQQS